MTKIPLKPLRKILGQNCPFPISNDAVVLLRDSLEDVISYVGSVSLKEFEDLNHYRKRQGLRPLKGLNGWSIRKACDKILKRDADSDWGLQSTGIVGPGGDTMYTHIQATKSAKKDTDTHGGTNGR